MKNKYKLTRAELDELLRPLSTSELSIEIQETLKDMEKITCRWELEEKPKSLFQRFLGLFIKRKPGAQHDSSDSPATK